MKTHFAIGLMALLQLAQPAYSQAQPTYKLDPYGTVRHPSIVQAIVITPDSQRAIVALNDGALAAYSLESRKRVAEGPELHSAFMGMAINPRGDRLATAIVDGYVSLFDPTSLKVLAGVKMPATPERLVFSPDGSALFVAMNNGHLVRMNTADLKITKDIFPSTGSRVLGLDCSRDGWIATADKDGNIKIWTTGLEPAGQWKAHEKNARSLAFDPSGQHLVSGGLTGEVQVWRMTDFALVKETKDLHRLSIESIAFGPNGQFVTGGYDGLCQFWDAKTFEGIRSYPNYRGYFTAGAISADGRWLVRGGSSLDFVPMDAPEAFERIEEYGGCITSVAVAAERKRFVSGGLDGRLIFWEVDKGVKSKTAQPGDWVTAVEFCDAGRAVAAGLVDGRIALYSVPTMELVKAWPAHDGRINAIAGFGDKLASLGDDGAIRVWDLQGNRLRTYDEKSACRSVAVHGSRFAVGTTEGALTIYDVDKEDPVKRIQARPLSLSALAFTRDGSKLIAGYYDGSLELFDTTSWTTSQFHPGTGERVLSIDVHPSQDLFAVGFSNGEGKVYDTSLRQLAAAQPTPVREIFSARWALEGNTVALAGASNAISFWKLQSISVAQDSRVFDVGAAGVRIDGELTKETTSIGYQVNLVQGKSYVIDMMAPPGSTFDSFLRLLDPSGREVIVDDDGGEGRNAQITYRANVSGTYRIVATSYQSSFVGRFTLTVNDRSIGPPATQTGEVLDVGSTGIRIDGEIAKGQSITYRVRLIQGRSYVIDMRAPGGPPPDCYLRLLDPSGTQVATDDDSGGGRDAQITYQPRVSGTFEVVATSFLGGSAGRFTLTVRER